MIHGWERETICSILRSLERRVVMVTQERWNNNGTIADSTLYRGNASNDSRCCCGVSLFEFVCVRLERTIYGTGIWWCCSYMQTMLFIFGEFLFIYIIVCVYCLVHCWKGRKLSPPTTIIFQVIWQRREISFCSQVVVCQPHAGVSRSSEQTKFIRPSEH